jgi:type IV pilus assembly protein PilM
MRSPRILAVDVGAGHVACGVFTAGATGRLVLQQFALEPHSADPAHESRWPVEIAQSLGAIAARQKISGVAALAVPGHLALTKFVKTPSVAKDKRHKIVAFEAAENIPYPLAEVVWDYAVVADDSFDLEVMLAAVKFDAMQALCDAADAAGFAVERATPAGLALCHAFRYNHPDVRQPVLVVNIGARSTHLLFLEAERFYLRTLPLAGNAVTLAIADELRIDFASAETLKVQVLSGQSDLPSTSPSRAAVQRAAQAFTAKLQLEITRSTVNHRRHSGEAAPTAIHLAGGGSLLAELPAALAEKLKVPVERLEPLRNVDVSADARASGADAVAPVLADLVGLATRLVAQRESEPSLLPPAITENIAFRKRQPWFAAAAACAVLALLPPIFFFHGVVEMNQAKIAQVDDQLMPLRSVQTRNEDNLRQIDEAKKQIDALHAAYATKSNWINFFSDLQSRLVKVEDVWLDRLRIERDATAEGGVGAGDRRQGTVDTRHGAGDGAQPTADASNQSASATQPPLRLKLSGRLLDVANPQSKVSSESLARAKQLVASFASSQFIASVENERFDTGQNGLLRFDFTLVINPQKPL